MGNVLIFKQILPTNSLRKCMEISLENLYLDIGALRVNRMGHFRVPKPSLSKLGQVNNLSCENKFYWHENYKSFPYQRLST